MSKKTDVAEIVEKTPLLKRLPKKQLMVTTALVVATAAVAVIAKKQVDSSTGTEAVEA